MRRRVFQYCGFAGCILLLVAGLPHSGAASPELEAFQRNTTGVTGQSDDPTIDAAVSSILADIQSVHYTAVSVYVQATGVPRYAVGPFNDGNPNPVSDIDTIYVFPRSPAADTSGTPTELGLGIVGIFVNGVAVFNAEDGMTHNNQNVWHRNAILAEADGFDACSGHPAPVGQTGLGIYHHHLRSECLLDQLGDDGSAHSPIVGLAADGFPIYGPYGYTDPTDPASTIVRIESSYQPRAIAQRTTLPDGTVLQPAFYGPDVTASGQYRIGWFMEDYEYVDGLGNLDERNGRQTVTPEYPGGTYAYYVTIDDEGDAAYPYYIGPSFYGEVAEDLCAGQGETWGPGIGPPPLGCEGGGGAGSAVETVDTVPGDAVVYAPEPEALPMALAAHAMLALMLGVGALRTLRCRAR